jgi:hypothetical protein
VDVDLAHHPLGEVTDDQRRIPRTIGQELRKALIISVLAQTT